MPWKLHRGMLAARRRTPAAVQRTCWYKSSPWYCWESRTTIGTWFLRGRPPAAGAAAEAVRLRSIPGHRRGWPWSAEVGGRAGFAPAVRRPAHASPRRSRPCPAAAASPRPLGVPVGHAIPRARQRSAASVVGHHRSWSPGMDRVASRRRTYSGQSPPHEYSTTQHSGSQWMQRHSTTTFHSSTVSNWSTQHYFRNDSWQQPIVMSILQNSIQDFYHYYAARVLFSSVTLSTQNCLGMCIGPLATSAMVWADTYHP